MGADLLTVAVRIPDEAIRDNGYDQDVLYRIVDQTSAADIVAAATNDMTFDPSDFGVDSEDLYQFSGTFPDEWHPTDPPAILLANPEAVAAIRTHLRTATDLIGSPHRYLNIWHIAGVTVALFGGTSWGEDPFDGFSTLCALTELPEFQVPTTPPTGLTVEAPQL
jgi:hypothetical protein